MSAVPKRHYELSDTEPEARSATATSEVAANRDPTSSLLRARQLVVRTLLLAAMLALAVSVPAFLLGLDVQWLHNSVEERSATEVTQLTFIAVIAASFGCLARIRPDDRRFALLAAGFFTCMLIRELDAVFDQLFDGLWQCLVVLVSVTCIAYASFDWRSTLRGMARLMASRSGVVLTIGLAILLVYSRLIGMGLLWKGLLGGGYERLVKNAVEESAELLGYVLILFGSVGFVGGRIRRLDSF